jgi:hypothetical protein
MTFKEYCRLHKCKCPLSEDMMKYYLDLGYDCFGVLKVEGKYHLASSKYNIINCLTLKELRFIAANTNAYMINFHKISEYINELRTNKTKTII